MIGLEQKLVANEEDEEDFRFSPTQLCLKSASSFFNSSDVTTSLTSSLKIAAEVEAEVEAGVFGVKHCALISFLSMIKFVFSPSTSPLTSVITSSQCKGVVTSLAASCSSAVESGFGFSSLVVAVDDDDVTICLSPDVVLMASGLPQSHSSHFRLRQRRRKTPLFCGALPLSRRRFCGGSSLPPSLVASPTAGASSDPSFSEFTGSSGLAPLLSVRSLVDCKLGVGVGLLVSRGLDVVVFV